MHVIKSRGIYGIRNTVNDMTYIGSTTEGFKPRWARHISDLKKGQHKNQYLQRAWNKYGADAFVFEVLEIIDKPETTIEREQTWIDCYTKERRCYNVVFQAQPVVNNHSHAKFYDVTIVAPTGVIYERISNLPSFCTQHELDYTSMRYVCIGGRTKRHKGWSKLSTRGTRIDDIRRTATERMADPEYKRKSVANLRSAENNAKASRSRMKTYAFIDPTGAIFDEVTDLQAFCAEHRLLYQAMTQIHGNGKLKSFHGWRKYIPEEPYEERLL